MSSYLRDKHYQNITITKEGMSKINSELESIRDRVNITANINPENKLNIYYIIRFDDKGFKITNFGDVTKHFDEAGHFNRIFYILECDKNKLSNREHGKSIEISFVTDGSSTSKIIVQDDDKSWVNESFLSLDEQIKKYKNFNNIVSNLYVGMLIQFIGVFTGFSISLRTADILSSKINIENSLVFTFIFVFLLFSNLWMYLYPFIVTSIATIFPSISFKKNEPHWLLKGCLQYLVNLSLIFFLGYLLKLAIMFFK
jgi:hypothetical protein